MLFVHSHSKYNAVASFLTREELEDGPSKARKGACQWAFVHLNLSGSMQAIDALMANCLDILLSPRFKDELPLSGLGLEAELVPKRYRGLRVISVDHLKEKGKIGHEFLAFRVTDGSKEYILRMERRPFMGKKGAGSGNIGSSKFVRDPMDTVRSIPFEADMSRYYHLSRLTSSSESSVSLQDVCTIYDSMRESAPYYELYHKQCFWFCLSLFNELAAMTGVKETRGKDYYRRGKVAGRFRIPFLWLLSKTEWIRPTAADPRPSKEVHQTGPVPKPGLLKNPATEIDPDQDVIIAVMGPTGTGKSTFVNVATGQNSTAVGDSLKSCTTEVQAIRCLHPDTQRPIVFVDTPGFDDTRKSDAVILQKIAEWLSKTYHNRITLAGIIYMHRITDPRMAGSPLKNLRVFQNLCGESALRKVLLATTMWSSKISPVVGIQREKQLHERFWKPMLELGSATARFQNTYESAWSIVDAVLARDFEQTPLLLQDEMVRLKRHLYQTQAGMALYDTLQRLVEQQEETIKELRHTAQRQTDPALRAQFDKAFSVAQDQLRETMDEIQRMKVPLERQMLGLFTFRPPPPIEPSSSTSPLVQDEHKSD